MKNLQRWGCAVLLAVMALTLAGCGLAAGNGWDTAKQVAGLFGDALEDTQLRQGTEQMLDAIIADDFTGAYSLVSDIATEADFRTPYEQLRPLLSGIESYELVPTHKSSNTTNGVTTVTITYMMNTGEEWLLVETTRTEGYGGLTGFYVDSYDPVTETGTVTTMSGADGLQWAFLIVGLLEMAFVVWMFVDCCCHKVKKKWVWLLVIGLGMAAVSVVLTDSQFRINYNLGFILNYTALIRYSTGGFTARILLPIGAFVYAIVRKKLFRDDTASLPAEPPAPQSCPGEEGNDAC